MNLRLSLPAELVRTGADPVLRHPASEVETFDQTVRSLVARMRRTMVARDGIGLAAPQIGVGLRVLLWDLPGTPEGWVMGGPPRGALVNPRIISVSDRTCVLLEGCLSLPGVSVPVTRPAAVAVEGIDRRGRNVRLDASGMVARVLLHELDHLDGALIDDHCGTT